MVAFRISEGRQLDDTGDDSRLHVHQNTIHYRLRQVERLTGRDLRRLRDVIDLVAALRLARAV